LKTAVALRLAIVAAIAIADILVPDYDTSTELLDYGAEPPVSPLDEFVRRALRGFSHWDAVYFTHIAQHGYTFEQFQAFFPCLPLAIRGIVNAVGAFAFQLKVRWLSTRAAILLSGVGLNFVAVVLGAVELHKLSRAIMPNAPREFHRTTALLYCIAPASVFLSVIYTEALYALFSFWGLRILFETLNRHMPKSSWRALGRIASAEAVGLLTAAGLLALSVGLRSTGFTYGLFFVAYLFYRFPPLQFRRWSLAECLWMVGVMAVCAVVILAPMVANQYFAYSRYCTDENPNRHLSPWCDDFLPNAYSYVQAKYWEVGFLRYYQFHQIPNFLLAAPVLVISASALFRFPWLPSASKPARNPLLVPFYLHWLFLFCTALTILHVQVATRFLSATPPLYWFIADLLLKSRRSRETYVLFRGLAPAHFGLLAFCFTYMVVGVVLFSNFYPWT